jgi:hypothetical protein
MNMPLAMLLTRVEPGALFFMTMFTIKRFLILSARLVSGLTVCFTPIAYGQSLSHFNRNTPSEFTWYHTTQYGVYTQRYKRLKKSDGSLFRGRSKGILLDHDGYLLHLSRYIHCKPIDMKSPLVTQLPDYY